MGVMNSFAVPHLNIQYPYMITHILIKNPRNKVHYQCQNRNGIWYCGNCGRGRLGTAPEVGHRCRVCDSKISQILTDAHHYLGSLPESKFS